MLNFFHTVSLFQTCLLYKVDVIVFKSTSMTWCYYSKLHLSQTRDTRACPSAVVRGNLHRLATVLTRFSPSTKVGVTRLLFINVCHSCKILDVLHFCVYKYKKSCFNKKWRKLKNYLVILCREIIGTFVE